MKLKNIVITKTPHRIGLIGGGTDIPAYYEINDGGVINFAINKFIYVTIKQHSHLYKEKYRLNYSRTEICNSISQIQNNIVRESLKYFAIDFPVYVETNSDIPSSSGMGSSSAFTVGLVNSITEFIGLNLSKMEIAEIACDIEINKVRSPIGKQDQYAAAFGGINHFSFKKNNSVVITPIKYNKLFKDAFIENSFILWTDIQRSANEVLIDQESKMHLLHSYYSELNECTNDFHELLQRKESSVEKKDLYDILNNAWSLKQKFSNKINTGKITEIINLIEKYTYHLKICGAGGGGFIYMNLNKIHSEQVKNLIKLNNFSTEKIDVCNRGTEVIYKG